MQNIDPQTLEAALGLLGDLVAEQPPVHYVVCGGSSLLALGLVRRTTTRDVDILAQIQDSSLITAKPLPDWLTKAANRVREELDLMPNWLNAGPSDDTFFRFGFPDGMQERLTTRDYGPSLRISFIGRRDQVFFKLYAAADQGTGRHFTDLQDLAPTRDELLAAARWTRRHDPSEGFLFVLGKVLEALGHASLIDQL